MRILAVITGNYGQRHVANLRAQAPGSWQIKEWRAPTVLPPIVDDPEEFVPANLASADLILSVPEHKGVAELIPDVARVTKAKAVIAGIDNEAWLPRGLARQLHEWLERIGVACVTPKPLCSLTETHYAAGRGRLIAYDEPHIAAFARHFGRPDLVLTVDPKSRTITAAQVKRDAVCGCAHHVVQGLVGIHVDDAEQKAGLLHAHYPCLANMDMDVDYGDTVMHVSGNITKDEVARQIKPFKSVQYIAPGTHSAPPDEQQDGPEGEPDPKDDPGPGKHAD